MAEYLVKLVVDGSIGNPGIPDFDHIIDLIHSIFELPQCFGLVGRIPEYAFIIIEGFAEHVERFELQESTIVKESTIQEYSKNQEYSMTQ